MAVICWVLLRLTLGLAGVIVIVDKVGAVRVSVVFPDTEFRAAAIVTVPCEPPIEVRSPAALILASPVPQVAVQVTDDVRFWVELSE
jgi:hypothetical protein